MLLKGVDCMETIHRKLGGDLFLEELRGRCNVEVEEFIAFGIKDPSSRVANQLASTARA
jgi:hypothetical protein